MKKEDEFAIRCFLNGGRKFTDKLSKREALIFRQAARVLYAYLGETYKLTNEFVRQGRCAICQQKVDRRKKIK